MQAFNAELEEYYKETGSEVPDIETTIIGSSGIIKYTVDEASNKITRIEEDASLTSPLEDNYKIGYYWDEQELLDQIKYDRRRLKKGWRVWKSENPDAELERDDEE